MRHGPGLVAGAVAAATMALAGLTASIGHGQGDPLGGAARVAAHDAALPAIDRGLRGADPPRDPSERERRLAAATGDDIAPAYVAGSLIVKFKGGAQTAAALSEVASTGSRHPAWADFDIVDIPPGVDAETAAAALRERPDVEYAQPRYLNHAMSRPNDPLYQNQWNFPAIDMERAWDVQPGASSEIVVAVLDSGLAFYSGNIRYNSRFAFRIVTGGPVYPALGPVTVPFAAAPELGESRATRFVAPRDFIWDDDLPVDLDGHGTHVAGTIGQLTNNGLGGAGMAYNVRLMPVKIIQGTWDEIFSSPNEGTDDVVARGIRYAVDNGAKVLNLSIGRTQGGPAPAVTEAVRYAVERGAFVAMAAGNTKEQGNAPNRLADEARAIDGAVAVGAVGRTLDAAYYSTTGAAVELAAPGGDQRQGGSTAGILQQTLDLDLVETYERPPAQFGPPRADSFAYYYFQGTSMATPHVSGFAALLMQQGLKSPAVIEAAMKRFATDKGSPGRDDTYGHGLINPRATLRGLGLLR